MDYKNMIPLGNLFERFLQLEKMDNIKDVEQLLAMLKYDKELRDKFDRFLETLKTELKK